MVTSEDLSGVMAQVGELLVCESVTEYAEKKTWIVVLDGTIALEVAFDDQVGLLQVVSDVGNLPGRGRERVLERLLQYNDQWPMTGGLRFGLDAAGEELSLIASFPAAGLEAPSFAKRLRRFSEMVADWRQLIVDGLDGGQDKRLGPADQQTEFAENLIRI
jgi:Tir chaperone family protein CesT